jgi:hypothetical protein
MSYEEFLKSVKEDATKMMMHAFEKEEAEAKIEEVWRELTETSGDKLFKDQFEDLKRAEKRFGEGAMKENVYKGRVQSAIGTAAWNVWMLA